MTSNAIKAQELKETKRHNRRQEEIDTRNANTREAEAAEKYKEGVSKRFHRGTADFFTGLTGAAKAINDFSWYSKFETTLRNALKQPTSDVVGGSKNNNNDGEAEFLDNARSSIRMHKNSITSFRFVPTIGSSDNADSAVVIATRDFNVRVRGANAGGTNYDAADLMMLPLATDSIVYMLAWLRKSLALITLLDASNPILNLDLLLDQQCYGIHNLAVDLRMNYPTYLAIYNEVVDKLNSTRLPSEMPYIKRHAFLASTLFFDGEGVGLHYYNVLPSVYYVYDELNSKLTHRVVISDITQSPDYAANIRQIFIRMLVPLLNSQTVNTMCGDMEKAGIKFIRLENVPVDNLYKFKPVVNGDPKYLQSFKNADIVDIKDYNQVDIRQASDPDNNPFLYQGAYSGAIWSGIEMQDNKIYRYDPQNDTIKDDISVTQFLGDRLIDYYDSNKITDEDQLYNLSFKVGSDMPAHVDFCRSEVIDEMTTCQFIVGQNVASAITIETQVLDNTDWVDDLVSLSTHEDVCEHMADVFNSFFYFYDEDYLPKLWFLLPDANSYQGDQWFLLWKRNHNRNYVDKEVIRKIQKYSLQSLFMIP